MKARIIDKEIKDFTPFKIELTIESMNELLELRDRLIFEFPPYHNRTQVLRNLILRDFEEVVTDMLDKIAKE